MSTIQSVLRKHHEALEKAWFDRMLNAYAPASRKYFESYSKEFANPVGSNVFQSIKTILDCLLSDVPDADRIYEEISMVMRIKAVQEVLPSQAVSFIPAFKQIVETVCGDELKSNSIDLSELMEFYTNVDTLALYAFDAYMESRMLIYDMRLAQIKETNDILVRANLVDQALDMNTFMQCSSSVDLLEGACASCQPNQKNQFDIDKGV